MIEYNTHVVDNNTHECGCCHPPPPPHSKWWQTKEGIGGIKMKSEPRDKGPPVTHTHARIGIFWFFRIPVGASSSIIILRPSNLHGILPSNARFRKCPKRPRNLPKTPWKVARKDCECN